MMQLCEQNACCSGGSVYRLDLEHRIRKGGLSDNECLIPLYDTSLAVSSKAVPNEIKETLNVI